MLTFELQSKQKYIANLLAGKNLESLITKIILKNIFNCKRILIMVFL